MCRASAASERSTVDRRALPLGASIPRKANLTLIGRARGKRFVALAGEERIVFDADLAAPAEEDRTHARTGSFSEVAE
jgi:hypothetical protein